MSDLQITAACQPAPFDHDLQTLACGGTLTNGGTEMLAVVAIGVTPGETQADVLEYALAPKESAMLPAPPAGGVWVIGAETGGQIRRRQHWSMAGAITVGALAGAGAASIGLLAGAAVGRAAKRRRQGY